VEPEITREVVASGWLGYPGATVVVQGGWAALPQLVL